MAVAAWGPASAGAVAHVFVPDVTPDVPELDPADAHHLGRVRRLRPGERVTVGDGQGRWRPCRVARGGASAGAAGPALELTADGDVVADPLPEPAIAVAFALTKGDRPELVVQKATEAGADRIVAFPAARTVVRWDGAKAARELERWRRVAREAAAQSRRAWIPEVDLVGGFGDLVGEPGACLADAGGEPPSLERPMVLVGPEGGWSDEERSCGLPVVSLGAGVYRAETAAVVASALLCALRAGVVSPVAAVRQASH